MITDLIAPVLTTEGVGSISTLYDMPLLSKGLKFLETTFFYTDMKGVKIYRLEYQYVNKEGGKRVKRLCVTDHALIDTIDGWKTPEEISISFEDSELLGHQYRKIWGCIHKCILCGEPYQTSAMSWGYCSHQCFSILSKKERALTRAITANNVKESLSEGWLELKSIDQFYVRE
jgi:hypothetical protein